MDCNDWMGISVVSVMSSLYTGYDASFVGGIVGRMVGRIWGFFVGAILGGAIGCVHNKIMGR